jgi:hypothetical protein
LKASPSAYHPGAVTSAFGGVAFTFFETAANGGLFDATAYLNPGLLANKWTATFFSDVEQVPEPGSLILFGTGLLAFGGGLRRKLRKLPSAASQRHFPAIPSFRC